MKAQNEEKFGEDANFDVLYQQLNAAQKKAVDTIEGPVVVIAGPGTGKTQVLTLRIANIVKNAGTGIGPEHILALTFTNAAVATLRERLAKVAGASLAYRVGIFTFHSFAEEQMRVYPEYFKNFFGSKAAGDLERLQVVESLVQNGDYEILKTFASDTHHTKAILSAIDKLKQEGVKPEHFEALITVQEQGVVADEGSYYKRNGKNYAKGDLKPDAFKHVQKNKELALVYHGYQQALKEKKLYDFNDMLLNLIEALETDGNFQAALMERYQYILVDEHQDTNGAQNKILELLTETPNNESPNLLTVGDDKQAIYRFQGASIENFLHFAKRFEDTVTIDLTHNYRSAQPILDAAHRLASTDAVKEHTALVASSTVTHEQLAIHVYDTYQEELAALAKEVATKIQSGVPADEIAIFYRENKFLSGIQEVLEKAGVAYVVSSKENILHDPVLRKLVWLLRAVANPLDNERLGEALLMDLAPVEPLDALTLFDELRYGRKRKSLLQLMTHAETLQDVHLLAPEKLVAFAQFITIQKQRGENMPFVEFFDSFVRESGFLKYILGKKNAETHLAQLAALLDEIKRNVSGSPVYRLANFLQFLETLLEYDIAIDAPVSSAKSGVRLMTAHGSKGLEFEHVYITDVVRGRWNDKRRINSFKLPIVTEAANLEDERRLFYVALTRAKKNITVSYAKKSSEGKPQEPSIFLTEFVTPELVEKNFLESEERKAVLFAPRVTFLPKLTSEEFVRACFLQTKLSATALNNYATSPLLYFFRNLIRLPSAQTKTLLYGNVVHKTLELFFQEAKVEGAIPELPRLLSLYEETLESEYLLHEYYQEFQKRGLKNLEAYYRERKAEFVLEIETEKRLKGLTFTLDSGEEIMLTGILDKLEYLADGTVRVIDYKTGKAWSEKNKEEKEKLRRQIVFYKLLLDSYQEAGKNFVMSEGVLDFVEANKKGQFEQERITVSDSDVARLKDEINQFATEILSGAFLRKDFVVTKDTKEYLELLDILESK